MCVYKHKVVCKEQNSENVYCQRLSYAVDDEPIQPCYEVTFKILGQGNAVWHCIWLFQASR